MVKMEHSNLSARKRAEKLFDALKSKEDDGMSINSHVSRHMTQEQTIKRKSNEMCETSCCTASKQKVYTVENKKFSSSNKDANIVNKKLVDLTSFKGLLQKVDDQLSMEELCGGLAVKNSLPVRCQSALSLAVLCQTQLKKEDCKLILDALLSLHNQQDSYVFQFCQALLLCMMTKQTHSSELIATLEKSILKIANSVINHNFTASSLMEAKIVLQGGERYVTAYKLCKEIFNPKNLDINLLNVSALCCSSLKSLSEVEAVSRGCQKFSDDTLKYILTMIGKSTQEISFENFIGLADEEKIVSIPAYTVSQCLQVLEQILCVDPSSPCKTLDHEEFSLLRCLTKLLEWNMMVLFPIHLSKNELFKIENSVHAFYFSTLLSILKVFSILSFHPDQYEAFTNIKGSMEKLMICILKIYFQSQEKHFDALVLALEMMINFSLKCKKTFVLLCVKKFKIHGSEELLAVEALIKILDVSLIKIREVKLKPSAGLPENDTQSDPQQNPSLVPAEQDINVVLEAADEDMELSMIVSFIGILLMYFIDTKKSFSDFVRERLSTEKTSEAVDVSNKFLQFSILTGGMPATGILLLRTSIRTLSRLHSS